MHFQKQINRVRCPPWSSNRSHSLTSRENHLSSRRKRSFRRAATCSNGMQADRSSKRLGGTHRLNISRDSRCQAQWTPDRVAAATDRHMARGQSSTQLSSPISSSVSREENPFDKFLETLSREKTSKRIRFLPLGNIYYSVCHFEKYLNISSRIIPYNSQLSPSSRTISTPHSRHLASCSSNNRAVHSDRASRGAPLNNSLSSSRPLPNPHSGPLPRPLQQLLAPAPSYLSRLLPSLSPCPKSAPIHPLPLSLADSVSCNATHFHNI